MKKLFIASAIALFATVSAQESDSSVKGFVKGDTFITGAVGYASTKTGNDKTNAFTVAPSAAYFVTPNVAVGARVGYLNLTNDDSIVKTKLDQFSAGIYGRYYWMAASRFSIFAELGADYTNSSYDDGIVPTVKAKSNGFGVAFAPGINYFLDNNFALEAKVGVAGYSSDKPDFAGAKSTDNFSIGLNLNDITLGLVYKF